MTPRNLVATLSLAALIALGPRSVRASEADAFENKVKPVSGQLYTKAGKLELTPTAELSLNDPFFSKYMGGLKLGYHFNEYFYAGITATGGFTSTTGSTNVCPTSQPCRAATSTELNRLPGLIHWIGGAELAFSPVYGKLNLFAEKALHFDLSVLAGADIVSYRDVLKENDTRVTPGDATSIGGHVGVGARIFFARFMALRLELKDVLYSVPNLATGKLQTQLMADIGLSFFLPVAGARTP